MKRLLLLIPVIIIVGCGLFGGKDYMPLTVNNQWVYNMLETVTVSSVMDTAATAVTTNTITSKTTIGGDDAYIMTTKDSMHMYSPYDTIIVSTGSAYIRDTKDAILSYGSDTTSAPDTFLLKDLKLDKTWTQISGTDTSVSTVVLQEDVTVPAATYSNCWKVKVVHNSGTPYYYWFADGTGMVKYSYIYTYYTATVAISQELQSATIK
jgi:hypothetical protein